MTLQTLGPDSKASDIVDAMQADGACIVRDVLSPETLAKLNGDVRPWIDRSMVGTDDFIGRKTKRTGALIARCPEVRPVVTNPLILEAANAFLAPHCERIQLHLTQTIDINPGQGEQPLHRDRLAWGVLHDNKQLRARVDRGATSADRAAAAKRHRVLRSGDAAVERQAGHRSLRGGDLPVPPARHVHGRSSHLERHELRLGDANHR